MEGKDEGWGWVKAGRGGTESGCEGVCGLKVE